MIGLLAGRLASAAALYGTGLGRCQWVATDTVSCLAYREGIKWRTYQCTRNERLESGQAVKVRGGSIRSCQARRSFVHCSSTN